MTTSVWQGQPERRSSILSLTSLRQRLQRGQRKIKFGPPGPKLILLVMCIALVSWLTGCTSTTALRPPLVGSAAIPTVLLNECYVSPAPTLYDLVHAKERYRVVGEMSDQEARFLLMTDHWLMQTDALGLCNKQLGKSREWVQKHRDLENTNESLGHPK